MARRRFATSASGLPHSPQNCSPGSFSALQEAQTSVSLAPQWAQNLRPARFSRPHFEQRIDSARRGQAGEP
jgi:hypothetical protein